MALPELYLVVGYIMSIQEVLTNNVLHQFCISWFSVYFPVCYLQVKTLGHEDHYQQNPTITYFSPSLSEHQPYWSPFFFVCLNSPKLSPFSGLLSNLLLNWKDCPPTLLLYWGENYSHFLCLS